MADVPQRRFHYAWIIAAVTFLILLASAGVRSAPGVLIVPLEKEFGWDRATISFAISVNLVLYGLMGPFAAALMGQLGIRRTVLISLSVVGLGVALTTLMTSSWQLIVLWGIVVGGGTGMTALVLATTLVNRWFAASRGLVLGVLTASTATGQLVFLPLMASAVEHFGWRWAAGIVAIAALSVIPLVLLLLRDWPDELGLVPYGATGNDSVRPPRSTVNPALDAIEGLRTGLKSSDFWLLAISFFVCGASTNGLVGTHLIPACLDQGIPEIRAAGLLAMMGIFDLAGTTASGWLSDRVDNRNLLCCYYAFRGLSLVYLPFGLVEQSWGMTMFAVFYGLDWIATVPPTARLTSDIFGKARAGIMFGWIVAAHQCGAAAAAFGAGAVRSWTGNYERAFLTSGALCLLTAALVLRIRNVSAADKTAKAPADEARSVVEQEALNIEAAG